MLRAIPVSALPGLLIAVAAVGCGPSLRRTEQSDNAFLRCFDMDYQPGRTADEKRDCWGRWLERRVHNQPADKLAYAELRLAELADGISVPGPPGPPGAFHERPEAIREAWSEPVPGSGDEVRVEPRAGEGGGEGDAGPDIDLSHPPGDRCARACRHVFGLCGVRCEARSDPGCRGDCEADYTACMRACFE
jgi:hypothetical protein